MKKRKRVTDEERTAYLEKKRKYAREKGNDKRRIRKLEALKTQIGKEDTQRG